MAVFQSLMDSNHLCNSPVLAKPGGRNPGLASELGHCLAAG